MKLSATYMAMGMRFFIKIRNVFKNEALRKGRICRKSYSDFIYELHYVISVSMALVTRKVHLSAV